MRLEKGIRNEVLEAVVCNQRIDAIAEGLVPWFHSVLRLNWTPRIFHSEREFPVNSMENKITKIVNVSTSLET